MPRLLLFAAAFTIVAAPVLTATTPSFAAECTGANCPPAGDSGGSQCEHEKKEPTTS